MATKHVTLPDIGSITLYKRRGSRSLRLSIGLNGEVRVSLPYWVSYKAAEEFAKGKASWILHQQVQRTPTLEHGQLIGKAHRLHFEPTAGERTTTRVSLTEVRVHHPITVPPDNDEVQARALAASIKALRQEAEQLLPNRLQRLAKAYGFNFKSVDVKRLKTRWGSCSSAQEITLNLFLMQLPWHLIDYVLLHELTHTKVMQHGKPFWNELERHLPGARKLRQEINTHQPVLQPHAHVT
jgi:predicted metal-dependent hydrolase